MRNKSIVKKRSRPKAPKFSGALAARLPALRPQGLLEPDDNFRQRLEEHRRLEDDKMLLLLQRYGLIQDSPTCSSCWYFLALNLARDFVSGLKQESHAGRKAVWGDVESGYMASGLLVVAMEQMMEPGSPTVQATKAAKVLAIIEPWKSLIAGETNPVEALRHRYATFKNHKFADVFRGCQQANPKRIKEMTRELVKK